MAEHTGSVEGSGEWEEEETTVVVELSGILESDFISQCDGECKVLGINTEKPLLQLDRYTFSGEYADTMGTNLIFNQEDAIDVTEDPRRFHEAVERPTKKMEYLCKVDKKLNMSRVFVSRTPRDEVDKDINEDNTIEEGNEEKEMDTSFSANKIPTAMPVDTESTVTMQQMDTSAGAASEPQMDTSSADATAPQMNTSNAAPVYPGPKIIQQCDPDG